MYLTESSCFIKFHFNAKQAKKGTYCVGPLHCRGRVGIEHTQADTGSHSSTVLQSPPLTRAGVLSIALCELLQAPGVLSTGLGILTKMNNMFAQNVISDTIVSILLNASGKIATFNDNSKINFIVKCQIFLLSSQRDKSSNKYLLLQTIFTSLFWCIWFRLVIVILLFTTLKQQTKIYSY